MDKGFKFISECIDLNHDGLGVFKINDMTVFASNALVGEKCQLEIEKVNSNYCTAKVIKTLNSSPNRVKPICKHFMDCGGCDIMHLNYQSQLAFKEKMGIETLKRIGHIQNVNSLGIVGMKNPYYYRNKVQVPFSKINNKTICGFYRKNTHFIIPFDECYIQTNESNDIIKFIKNLANEYHIDGYVENNKQGILRHVLIRKNCQEEYMIILVVKRDQLNNEKEIVEKIIKRYPYVKSILINVQEKDSNVILGEKTRIIYGKDELIDDILGYKFVLSHKSFFQVNHEQTENLYKIVREFADLKESDILLDAYCGVGTIGITLSKFCQKVYGIEIVPQAIANAKENSKINNVNNIEFYLGAAEEVIQKLDVHFNCAVFDPPRKGCDQVFLNTIMNKNIDKLVYVSCNVATLARDLNILSEKYEIKKLKFVDMFPHSADVETVCLLAKLN